MTASKTSTRQSAIDCTRVNMTLLYTSSLADAEISEDDIEHLIHLNRAVNLAE